MKKVQILATIIVAALMSTSSCFRPSSRVTTLPTDSKPDWRQERVLQPAASPQNVLTGASTESEIHGLTRLRDNSRGFAEYRNEKDGSILVLVPEGLFIAGAPEGEEERGEVPLHTSKTKTFLIGKYEVTNEQFARFTRATGHPVQGKWQEFADVNDLRIMIHHNLRKVIHPLVSMSLCTPHDHSLGAVGGEALA